MDETQRKAAKAQCNEQWFGWAVRLLTNLEKIALPWAKTCSPFSVWRLRPFQGIWLALIFIRGSRHLAGRPQHHKATAALFRPTTASHQIQEFVPNASVEPKTVTSHSGGHRMSLQRPNTHPIILRINGWGRVRGPPQNEMYIVLRHIHSEFL